MWRAFLVFAVATLVPLDAAADTPTDPARPLRVLFDTDMDSDNDDASALAILHALADRGEVEILAVGVASRCAESPACVDAINTWYGRGAIPIGTYNGTGLQDDSRYAAAVAQRCPHDTPPAAQVPGAVDVYRRILSASPDASVTMIAVGPMDNLVDLLNSPADGHSRLAGRDLVRRKIVQTFVMAPYFNERNEYQRAYNFLSAKAAVDFVNQWSAPVRFGEGNLGHRHEIGARLAETPAENPVRIAFENYFDGKAKDRHCADPTTVLYAVTGTHYFGEVGPGRCDVRPADGYTRWDASTNRGHYYNTEKLPIEELERVMDELLLATPASRQPAGRAGKGGEDG